MLTKKEIIHNIQESREQIQKYGVKKIGLFGSFTRNEQKEQSDVDIIVEFKKGMKTFDNYMELKFYLEKQLKCKVDLVILDALKPQIKPYIMREVEYA
ncbi:MAG TPA: nucleotidyltransferase family protein [Candidatus Bathyarchaeia archaeon]|nr:nucleotidyltransferase family protein [Candidatus Bathyarchaeia archaeon]